MREWLLFLAPDIAGLFVGLAAVAGLYALWKYAPYLEDGNVERLERQSLIGKARDGRVKALEGRKWPALNTS